MNDTTTYLGIEIGGTKLQLAVGDGKGTIIHAIRYAVEPARGAQGIQEQLTTAIQQIKEQYAITATGVGFGGPVDWQTGIIQTSHQVPGWQHFNLKAWLQSLTHSPVIIDNDANVAALAEAVHGSGQQHNQVFYMTIGSGIGGSMILHRQIYHGSLPGEVEIGHLRLDKKGTTLESVCSGWAVDKKVREYATAHPQSLLGQLVKAHPGKEAALLLPALQQEDNAAQQIVQGVADDIAWALSHVVHLFHPETIIIGGGLSLLQQYLTDGVSQRLPHYLMTAFLPPPAIHTAALGEQVVPIGALVLAKQALDY